MSQPPVTRTPEQIRQRKKHLARLLHRAHTARVKERHSKEKRRSKAARKLEKALNKEAKSYEKIIQTALARLGLDHWIRKEARDPALIAILNRNQAHQKVQFLRGAVREDAIYIRIDVRRLPYQTTILDLGTEDTLATISHACGRRVTFVDNRLQPERGVWYCVEREGFLGAIPRRFRFKSALKNIPTTASWGKFTAGVGLNLKLVQPDLAKGPHLLVGGGTGWGKSNFINATLMQLLLRNSPDELHLHLIDLKDGMELQDYEELPHTKQFVRSPEDVPACLEEFSAEMKRRARLLAASGNRDIRGYNVLHPYDRLPYILLVVDELGQVLLNPDPKLAKRAGLAFASLVAVSRATGGHAILCTQLPNSVTVPNTIKVNLNLRISFRMGNRFDSEAVLGHGGAELLEHPGRAIMVNGPRMTEIQTPFITPRLIRLGIKKLMEGDYGIARAPTITVEEVARCALENYAGYMLRDEMIEQFREQASTGEIRKIVESLDTGSIEIDGITYHMIRARRPDGRGVGVRKLIPETGNGHDDLQTSVSLESKNLFILKGRQE